MGYFMRFRNVAGAALAWSVVAQAAPADVNAESFYVDAVALRAKGMAAMFDGPMVEQMKDAESRARAENLAATAAGRPIYCVPADAKRKGIGAKQAIAMLGELPESERRSLSLVGAWKRALSLEYPCR